VIAVVTAAVCLVLLQLLLTRTSLGLHMRAASMDFRTAQLLGVRANRVIAGAVVISALFAAIAAVLLSVEQLQVTSTFGLSDTIFVLAGVVLGGLNRPVPATLGGFSIGFATGILGGTLPSNQSQYLPSILFAAVIVVLLVRPNGLFTRGGGAVQRV
jgi:branched-chain amino acid transport system permease protein